MPHTRCHVESIQRQVLHRLRRTFALWSQSHALRDGNLAHRLLAQWAHAQRFELREAERSLVDSVARALRREDRVITDYLSPMIGPGTLRHLLLSLSANSGYLAPARRGGPGRASLRALFCLCDDEALASYAVRRNATSLKFARDLARRRTEVERVEQLVSEKIDSFAHIGAYLNRHLYAYRDLSSMPPELAAITEKFITASVAFEAHVRRGGHAVD